MTKVPFWASDDPAAVLRWDFCWLGGHMLPGVCRVKKATSARDVETNPSPGVDGASTKDKGAKPPTYEIELTIYTEEQWEAWTSVVRPAIDPQRPNAVSQPQEIIHAVPNHAGTNQVQVLEIEDEPPKTAAEPYRVTISVQKYYPKAKEAKTSKTVKKQAKVDNWVERLPEEMPNMVETTFGKPPGS